MDPASCSASLSRAQVQLSPCTSELLGPSCCHLPLLVLALGAGWGPAPALQVWGLREGTHPHMMFALVAPSVGSMYLKEWISVVGSGCSKDEQPIPGCGAPAEFITTSRTGEPHFTDAEAATSTSQVSLTSLESIHGTSL